MKKVLFIGLGGIGQRHLRLLLKYNKNLKIYALKSLSRNFEIDDNLKINKNINIINKYNISILKSLKQAQAFNIDLAVISNPTYLHAKFLLNLLRYRIPTFVEKPLSHNNQNINQIIAISKKYRVKFFVGFMLRHHPLTQQLKILLDKKSIGNVHHINVTSKSFMPEWHKYEKYTKLYASNESMGGGIILTECHEIDLINFFFGKPSILSVFSDKLSNYNLKSNDTAIVNLKYKNQKSIILSNIYLSFTSKQLKKEITIFGEKGSINYDILNSILKININGKNTKIIKSKIQRNEIFMKQWKFIISVLDGKKLNIYNKFFDINLITHDSLISMKSKSKKFA